MGLTIASAKSNPSLLLELQDIRGELRFFLKLVEQQELSPQNVRLRSRELLNTLKQLRELIGIHLILEQDHGYLNDPDLLASNYRDRMDGLRAEHQSLHLELGSLVEHGERLFSRGRYEDLARDSLLRYGEFLLNVRVHEDREAVLIAAVQNGTYHSADAG